MGLMDKVKLQAGQLADKAQEAGKAGQAKIEALQAKKHVKQVLSEIGTKTYLEHENRSSDTTDQELEALFGEVKKYEDNYGPIDTTDFKKDASQ